MKLKLVLSKFEFFIVLKNKKWIVLIGKFISFCFSKYDINFEGVIFFICIVLIKVIDFMFLKKKLNGKIIICKNYIKFFL